VSNKIMDDPTDTAPPLDEAIEITTGIAGTSTENTGTTDNGMVADPRKDGIPLFLQTQNRDRGAGPLLIYEDAKRELAAASTVDEVKGIRDRALGLAAYAKQASKRHLEAEAEAIRLRRST
jgi:hypothetical protein